MHNRQASRERLIDEEVEAFKASISGQTPIDEGRDLEVLDVITEAPLSMVLPTEEVLVIRCRRTIVTEDSEVEETVWGKRGVGLTFKSDPGEGIMAYRGQIRLRMELPLRRLVKEVLNFWEAALVQMNGNFYVIMTVIEGMNAKLTGLRNLSWSNPRNYIDTLLKATEDWVNSVFGSRGIKRQRRKKVDSLLRSVPITLKPSKRKRSEGVLKGKKEIRGEKLPRNYQQVPTQTVKGKGHVASEAPKVQQSKVGQCKRCRALGEDDVVDEYEEQTEAWVRLFNKAMKSAMGKLRQAMESQVLSQGPEASLLSKVKKLKKDLEVITDSFDGRLELQREWQEREWSAKLAAKEREKAEQRANFQRQYDGECKMNVRLKRLIDDKGHDLDTLKPYPDSPKLVDGGDLLMKEADVVDEAGGGTGGGVETSIIGVASVRTVDGMVVGGSNPSTEAVVRVCVGGPMEEEGITAPI
ncbi:hypothetical protein GIB67_021222 [Kingdonia uniflora]|uniref:Uncharacterized protein n=1 Tax=Kingdonia uniflora TaxID=39325 RepID=A0A7J7LFG6_9MAGN|nr:hypothetical protein GIB67_021222 [Kingdonia uniflora]